MDFEWLPIGKVKNNPNNPRTITDEALRKLAQSIKEFPKMLELRPIVVNDEMVVLGGNMRLKACKLAGLKKVPVLKASDLTEEEQREFIIKDNLAGGQWDSEMLNEGWTVEELAHWGLDIELNEKPKKGSSAEEQEARAKLADRFVVPPFTVLDTRQKYWKERKKHWRTLIKDFGESREAALATGGVMKDMNNGVSLLDPVLAELANLWFCPPGGSTFDCFAGDSVFGYVSAFLGHSFTGIELRKEQAELNAQRVEGMAASYINDDGQNVGEYLAEGSQDLLFSCPPYFDLEIYSDLENDASNQGAYEDFLAILRNAFSSAIRCLRQNRFAFIVVGDIRDKKSAYRRFPDHIKDIFTANGMVLYNELVLVEPLGTLPQRVTRFMANRKVGKCHQNVLVFYKGDVKEIKKEFPKLELEIEEEDESTDFEF